MGTVTIVDSTISTNDARWSGGGIRSFGSGSVELTNATIANNRADSQGEGSHTGPGDTTHDGGGISSTISVLLHNTIVADNYLGTGAVGDELDTTVNSLSSHNLIGTFSSSSDSGEVPTGQGNRFVTGDARLGPLQHNGGLTQTHALLGNSPAVDAGLDLWAQVSGLQFDQRGEPRFQDGGSGSRRIDIGAFELEDGDTDGVDDSVEDRAPNEGDGNRDGVPDKQQENVASLRTAVGSNDFVTIAAPAGRNLSRVSARSSPGNGVTASDAYQYPLGFIGFTVSGAPAGESTTTEIIPEKPVNVNSYQMVSRTAQNPSRTSTRSTSMARPARNCRTTGLC